MSNQNNDSKNILHIDVLQYEDWHKDLFECLYINGKCKARVYSLSEYPEDARIGRGLISASEIAGYIEEVIGLMPQFDAIEFHCHHISKDPDFMNDDEIKAELPERLW